MWLRDLVISKGARLVTGRIRGDLLEQEDELLSWYDAHFIVNATGLGGLELAADQHVYPLRGALIRVLNDGSRFPVVSEALVVANDYEKRDEDGGIVFIVPRNDKMLILGGEVTLDASDARAHVHAFRYSSAQRKPFGPYPR